MQLVNLSLSWGAAFCNHLYHRCTCLATTWNNDANHLFAQEALAATCRTLSMSYLMDGDTTLQKSAPGKEWFNSNKGAIHA